MARMWMGIALLAGSFALAGCGQQAAQNTGGDKKEVVKADPDDDGHGWWCVEHGVIEDDCSMCQKKVFKKLKPDEICPKHPDRAKAQCFICNPELWEKSKVVYRAKYDKDPPEPTDNLPGKK